MDEYIKKADVLEYLSARKNQVLKSPLSTLGAKFEVMGIFDFVSHRVEAADVDTARHGRWIEPSRLYYGAKQYECSLCCSDTFWKKHSITEKYPHCPNCGAKMDGGDGNSTMA